jgi:hypothetical protein
MSVLCHCVSVRTLSPLCFVLLFVSFLTPQTCIGAYPFYVAYQADFLGLYSYVLRVDIAQRFPTSERKYLTKDSTTYCTNVL